MAGSSAEQIRALTGPAIRPRLPALLPIGCPGGLLIAVALRPPMLSGRLVLPSAFTPIQWHVHEAVYGYVPANRRVPADGRAKLDRPPAGPSARRCSCYS